MNIRTIQCPSCGANLKVELIRNGEADYYVKYYPQKIMELKAELSVERTSGGGEYVLKNSDIYNYYGGFIPRFFCIDKRICNMV